MKETFDEYLQRLKDRRTEDNYKYTDEDFIQYNAYIKNCYTTNLSVYKCLEFMSFAKNEIHTEQIWNKEKMEDVKELIDKHKKETLEEVAEILFPDSNIQKRIFIKGAKWQQQVDLKEIKLLREELEYEKRIKR